MVQFMHTFFNYRILRTTHLFQSYLTRCHFNWVNEIYSSFEAFFVSLFFCLISVVGFIRKCRCQCMLIACIRDRHTYTATTTQCRLLVCKQKYFTAQINKWLFSFIWLFVFMSFSFPSLRQSCAKERKNEKKDVISTTIKFMPDNYARIYFMNLCKTEKCKKATFYCFFFSSFSIWKWMWMWHCTRSFVKQAAAIEPLQLCTTMKIETVVLFFEFKKTFFEDHNCPAYRK